MKFDHVSYAAEPDGLAATTERLAQTLGIEPLDGGYHPQFGTRNMLLPLTGLHYVEIVEVLDHPAAAKCHFGQAVRQRSEEGGGWLGWVVSTADLTGPATRLGRQIEDGHRRRPDGIELRWTQLSANPTTCDPQLPYIISWCIDDALRPGADKPTDVRIAQLTIAGDPDRVREWLGTELAEPLRDVHVEWVSPHGTPGLMEVAFVTAQGTVQI